MLDDSVLSQETVLSRHWHEAGGLREAGVPPKTLVLCSTLHVGHAGPYSSTRSSYDTHFTTEETETRRVQVTQVHAAMLVKTSSVGLKMRWSTTLCHLPSPPQR